MDNRLQCEVIEKCALGQVQVAELIQIAKVDDGLQYDASQNEFSYVRQIHRKIERHLLIGLAMLQHVHVTSQLQIFQLLAMLDQGLP